MRILAALLLVVILVSACNKEPDENVLIIEKLSGYVQKGPYLNGTSITIFARNSEMVQTGDVFNTQISNNQGYFELQNLELQSPYAELKATGYYFDEVRDETSASQLTLYALTDLGDASSINVNLLTHLEIDRIKYLMENDQSFAESKEQALQEVLGIFGLQKEGISNPELLDISVNSDDNARLLAISAILQGQRSVGDLSELLANIKSDMREDGIMNSEGLKADLYFQAQDLHADLIKDALHDRYEDQGLNREIPDFSEHLDTFMDLFDPFEVSATVSDISCNPESLGSISLDIISNHPPVTILWSTGETTPDINNLQAGMYEVRITDYYGYIFDGNYEVKDGFSIEAQITHETIQGGDGAIDLTISGGAEPYNYSWSNGAVIEDLQNLSTGQYQVSVSDAAGCSSTRSFPLKGEMEDERDGQLYKTIKIGDQTWMAEYLNIGTLINTDMPQSDNDIIEKHCFENSLLACDNQGGLYQWNELMDYPLEPYDDQLITQGICPDGWHVPNQEEWEELIAFLDGSDVAGGKLKEKGSVHWFHPNVGATDEVGFSAIPNGDILVQEQGSGEFANFWTSSPRVDGKLCLVLESFSTEIHLEEEGPDYSRPVRCLRD